MGFMLAGCAVTPLTPTPVNVTAPPVAIAVVTFTPAPASSLTPTMPATVEAMPSPTASAAAPRPLPAPTDAPVSVVVAPPTALPPVRVAPPLAADAVAAEQYTVDLINFQRAATGAAPLVRDETLMGIARARVADMVARGYTGHDDPVTGEHLARAMMRAAGYTSNYLGENWYGSIQSPPGLVDTAMGWFMTDPPHADNLLSPNYVFVGVGIAFNGQQWLLVQDFAGPNQ